MAAPLQTTCALVTGREMAKPDPETHQLVAALAARGITGEIIPWQAETDWARFPLVVVRTPWDYFAHLEHFLHWVEQTAQVTELVNPPQVIRWNSHKAYLRTLAAQGLPTVPTQWFAAGQPARLAELPWDTLVIKPAVSIGAIGALRGRRDDPACQRHLDALLATGDVLVQPYLPAIASEGEVSLIFFDGVYSHAICKRPAAGDYRVQDMYGGSVHAHAPSAEQIAVARAALQATPAPTTYARVDLVSHAGHPTLMELELIEPELFLGATPDAAEHFAAAIAAHLQR